MRFCLWPRSLPPKRMVDGRPRQAETLEFRPACFLVSFAKVPLRLSSLVPLSALNRSRHRISRKSCNGIVTVNNLCCLHALHKDVS